MTEVRGWPPMGSADGESIVAFLRAIVSISSGCECVCVYVHACVHVWTFPPQDSQLELVCTT